jgi:hypothetical protein
MQQQNDHFVVWQSTNRSESIYFGQKVLKKVFENNFLPQSRLDMRLQNIQIQQMLSRHFIESNKEQDIVVRRKQF